ncbi:MAG: NAD(P)/FAD-dependent oxidoreductase [Desulfovibrionaceae bacterium]
MNQPDRYADLVLAGGGHAHMTVMANLNRFHDEGFSTLLVNPSPLHYYSGMGPGMLGGFYEPEQIRFNVEAMVRSRGGDFLDGKAVRIEPERRVLRLEDGTCVGYRALSCNVGSRVNTPELFQDHPDVLPVKPIAGLSEARTRLAGLAAAGGVRVVVAGGGAAALETAGAAARLIQDNGSGSVTVLAGRKFLSNPHPKARAKVLENFASRGIEVVEGSRVSAVEGDEMILEDGSRHGFDLAFAATGVAAQPLFRDSGLPTGDKDALVVNEFLRCPEHPAIFGGGDCIHFAPKPLDKVGVYAVRQNPVLLDNLLAALTKSTLRPFIPQNTYMLIFNLGDGRGVFCRGSLVFDGPLAFKLKNYIDVKFMRDFQKVYGQTAI